MRRHLPWVVGAAVVAAFAILLLVVPAPPVAEAPTATPGAPAPGGAGSAGAPSGGEPSTAPASPSASPSSVPTPRLTPPPGSASLPPDAGTPPEGYRPPPDSFDPSTIPWAGDAVTGSSQEKRFGLWTATLDGRDLREIARGEVGTGPVVPAEDGSVAFVHVTRDGRPLWVAPPDGDAQPVLPTVTELAAGPGGWYAAAIAEVLRDDGVWQVTSDGAAFLVAPPDPGPPCNAELFGERHRAGIAVSVDGVIASGVCRRGPDDDAAFRLAIQVVASGTADVLDIDARPLGFDPQGRVLAQSDEGFVAVDLGSRSAVPLEGDASGQARVTPGGRWLVTFTGASEITAHDLASGAVATWHLPAAAIFDLTSFGDETHVVLESFPQFPQGDVLPGWHVVVDLEEGWLGYLPPIAPLRDDAPE